MSNVSLLAFGALVAGTGSGTIAAYAFSPSAEMAVAKLGSAEKYRISNLHKRRRLMARLANEAELLRGAVFWRRRLSVELTEARKIGNGLGICEAGMLGHNAAANAHFGVERITSIHCRLQAATSSLLVIARDNLELINRTLTPTLRTERDALDRHLALERERQSAARNANTQDVRMDSQLFVDRQPLALAGGLANWTAVRIVLWVCWREDNYRRYRFAVPHRRLPRNFATVFVPYVLDLAGNASIRLLNSIRIIQVWTGGASAVASIFDMFCWGGRQFDEHCAIGTLGRKRCERITSGLRNGLEIVPICAKASLLFLSTTRLRHHLAGC